MIELTQTEFGSSITGINKTPTDAFVKSLCNDFGVKYNKKWMYRKKPRGEIFIPDPAKIARANKKIMSGK